MRLRGNLGGVIRGEEALRALKKIRNGKLFGWKGVVAEFGRKGWGEGANRGKMVEMHV